MRLFIGIKTGCRVPCHAAEQLKRAARGLHARRTCTSRSNSWENTRRPRCRKSARLSRGAESRLSWRSARASSTAAAYLPPTLGERTNWRRLAQRLERRWRRGYRARSALQPHITLARISRRRHRRHTPGQRRFTGRGDTVREPPEEGRLVYAPRFVPLREALIVKESYASYATVIVQEFDEICLILRYER